jgi:hypothetical protein
MPKRYEPVVRKNFERRNFTSLSDVRHEMSALYWQCKAGKVDKGIAPSLVKLLDLIAHYMAETEAEIQAQGLRRQIEEARNDLLARGVHVPPMIDITPDKTGS